MEDSIRGLIYGRFKSIRKFGEAVGWDRTKACNIVNGSREPRLSDLQDMSKALDKPVEYLADIFLQKSSQNCDSQTATTEER